MVCRTAERFHLLHWLDDPTLTNMYGLSQPGRAFIYLRSVSRRQPEYPVEDDCIGMLVDPSDVNDEIWMLFVSNLCHFGLEVHHRSKGILEVSLGHWAGARLQIHRYRLRRDMLVPLNADSGPRIPAWMVGMTRHRFWPPGEMFLRIPEHEDSLVSWRFLQKNRQK